MTVTKTADYNATLQQIAALAATGCDIVRVAVPDRDDAEALGAIASHSTIPVIADIHFQWKYALQALEAGCHGIRINPGNIRKHDKVGLIARAAHTAPRQSFGSRLRGNRCWRSGEPRRASSKSGRQSVVCNCRCITPVSVPEERFAGRIFWRLWCNTVPDARGSARARAATGSRGRGRSPPPW